MSSYSVPLQSDINTNGCNFDPLQQNTKIIIGSRDTQSLVLQGFTVLVLFCFNYFSGLETPNLINV